MMANSEKQLMVLFKVVFSGFHVAFTGGHAAASQLTYDFGEALQESFDLEHIYYEFDEGVLQIGFKVPDQRSAIALLDAGLEHLHDAPVASVKGTVGFGTSDDGMQQTLFTMAPGHPMMAAGPSGEA